MVRVAAAEDGALQVLLHQRQHRQVQRHLGVHQAADRGGHAGAALGGDHQVAVDVLAMQLADGDDHLVGHESRGGFHDAHQRGVHVRIHMGGTEFQRRITLPLDRLDDEDVPGARVGRTLQCGHAHPADADDCHVLAGPDVGGAGRRAVARRHAAADQTGHLERDRRIDLHHRALVHHHVRREGAEQGHREDVLALGLDPEGAVRDGRAVEQARAKVAQVAQTGLTRRTPAAGRDERQHHVVAGCDVLDSGADLGDDAGALMTAQHREAAHRDAAGDQVVVGVAHPRRFHLDLHLVLDGVADLDLLDRPRLVELPDESAFCLHPMCLPLGPVRPD